MNRDAVFLDLWKKVKDMGEEVQAKLLYIYLQACLASALLRPRRHP